jgi:hypothetical protein
MGNMNQALAIRDRVLKAELKEKSIDELIKLKSEAELRESNRIQNIDWDDCFISSQIDQSKISIINQLLDTREERNFDGTTLTINDYTIEILEANKRHYHIINKNLKIDVDYYAAGFGSLTGKGARKYVDELEEINEQVKKYMKANKYM